MKIRFANKKDVPLLKNYLIEMWLMHADYEPEYLNRGYIEKSLVEKYLAPCFIKLPKSYILIAEDNSKIIGFLKVDITKIEKFFSSFKILYLDDLYILKEYRKKGIAKLLMSEAENMAKEKKLKIMKARIYSFNKPSQNLFSLFSFKPLYSEWFKVIK